MQSTAKIVSLPHQRKPCQRSWVYQGVDVVVGQNIPASKVRTPRQDFYASSVFRISVLFVITLFSSWYSDLSVDYVNPRAAGVSGRTRRAGAWG